MRFMLVYCISMKCKHSGCDNKPGIAFAHTGYCGKHQPGQKLSAGPVATLPSVDRPSCQAVDSASFGQCQKRAKVGNLCAHHNHARVNNKEEVLTWTPENAKKFVAENPERFLEGPKFFSQPLLPGETPVFEGDVTVMKDSSDKYETWIESNMELTEVNVEEYARQVTSIMKKTLFSRHPGVFNESEFTSDLIDYLETIGADKPENWEVPTILEDWKGVRFVTPPVLKNNMDGTYLAHIAGL